MMRSQGMRDLARLTESLENFDTEVFPIPPERVDFVLCPVVGDAKIECVFVSEDVVVLTYACAKGMRMGRHHHEERAVVMVYSGSCSMTIEARGQPEEHLLNRGDTVVVPEKAVHSFAALSDCGLIATYILSRRTDGIERMA
jgi:quercetin dioxygenase-like cupin family protein